MNGDETMITLDKIEWSTDEYDKEVQRENAYFVNEVFSAIIYGLNLSENVRKHALDFTIALEKEIGKKEFTVGLDRKEE